MESFDPMAPPEADTPALSVFQRLVAVFVRPAAAWGGLLTRAQWWFPLLIMMIASGVSGALLHQRALVPMIEEQWERRVQDGQMPQEQLDKMESFISSPAGLATIVAQQVVAIPLITLLAALLIWFGCGFVLGTRFRYRLALEVAAWGSLITLPGYILTTAIAWNKETMRGIHTGFGVLLPDSETPSKIMVGLGAFLDGIGPLSLWYLAVVVLGATALSGARRQSVAWVLGGIYLAMLVFGGTMAAMFAPSA